MSKNIPQLRFEGFTYDWEQRKLGDIARNTYGGGTPKTSIEKYWSGEFPWIQSSDLILDSFESITPSKFITSEAINNSATKIVPKNSIAIVTRVGVGKLAFIPFDYSTSQDFLSLSNLKTDGYFSLYSIYKILKKEINNLQGTSIKGITKADLLDKVISIPKSLEEQTKIGDFFKQLDDTIALHQRKLDLLKEQKKGYLQKMFPKNGAKVPELRFAGFADDWEERKLKDVSTYIRGSFPQPYTNPDFYDEKNGKPFVQVADIGYDLKLKPDTKSHISKLAESKSRFVEAGKVVVALQGSIETSIGRTAITQYDAFFDRTILIFQEYKVPIDKQYFSQIIKKLFEREKERAWGATISTITKEHLNDFIVGVPSIEEQQKIGTFFKQLDDTIALHQRKLDLLKEQKKGFLQKMFV